MEINFRKAMIMDLALVQHWDKQQHVIDCDPDDEWDWEFELQRFPNWREQLIAQLGNRPIGFVQIIDPSKEESHYWGNVPENWRAIDIWIGEKEDLGKGYGTQMMHQIIKRCFDNDSVDRVVIDPLASNTKAIRFYKRLGFQFVENRTFGDSNCEVYQLERIVWNKNTQ